MVFLVVRWRQPTKLFPKETHARFQVLWSGEGRTKATLEKFFSFLGPERAANLEGICCDMWQPYVDVIMANAPNAMLVFDKMHSLHLEVFFR